jgi:hypothetical protein
LVRLGVEVNWLIAHTPQRLAQRTNVWPRVTSPARRARLMSDSSRVWAPGHTVPRKAQRRFSRSMA